MAKHRLKIIGTLAALSLLTGLTVARDQFKSFGIPIPDAGVKIPADNPELQDFIDAASALDREKDIAHPFDGSSMSGNFLAAQFAQTHHDWQHAVDFLDVVMARTPLENNLQRKAMVLAMGAGRTEDAIDLAKEILEQDNDHENALAKIFVATEHFKNQEFDKAAAIIHDMPEDSLSLFIWPLLQSWTKAAQNILDTEKLQSNTLHLYHAILISDYLGKTEEIEPALQRSLSAADGLTSFDVERVADIYAHIGKKDTAIELYDSILKQWPDNPHIRHKLDELKNNDIAINKKIPSPEFGIAESFHDMATLLYHEGSDESARVFAHMALYLNPNMDETRLLLGQITSRNEQFKTAIEHYRSIQPQSPYYIEARRQAASILEDSDRTEEALAELRQLAMQRGDIQSLIEIGNIYRREGKHLKAVESYNQAAEKLGKEIPSSYWFLLYARGMSYEQSNQWEKAEADLEKALEYKPNHPYILNYLGYAWADKGINLDKSLDLLKKATLLQPDDGYIADSLGWVYFKTKDYQEATPYLEKAVELMPYDPVINDHLGDVYWLIGRYLEARFQWQRARNHIEDGEEANNTDLIKDIEHKLEYGLVDNSLDIVKSAKTEN